MEKLKISISIFILIRWFWKISISLRQFCKISISIKYRIDSNLAYRTGLAGHRNRYRPVKSIFRISIVNLKKIVFNDFWPIFCQGIYKKNIRRYYFGTRKPSKRQFTWKVPKRLRNWLQNQSLIDYW